MRPCSSRISSSTSDWIAIVCEYCAAPLAAVMATTSTGIWYRMRWSRASNMLSARLITTGYAAVIPATSRLSPSASATRPR